MNETTEKFEQWASLVGPSFDFPIELGKVREFANSICSYRAEHHAGKNPIIPPTFPVVAGYLWGYIVENAAGDNPLAAVEIDEALSLDAEQEYIYYGSPPRAGDELVAQTSMDRVWTKQGRRGGATLTFYRTRTDYHDGSGRLIATNFSTSVVPSDVPETPSTPDIDYMQLPYCGYHEERNELSAIEQSGWDDLNMGEGPGAIKMPALTLTDIVTYQIVSGSRGAGHHDVIAARAEGWPNYFSVAMLHGGMLGTYATNWLGPDNVRQLKLRFVDVIWPGDVLSYSGSVTRKYEDGGERKVDLELKCARPDGDTPTLGWATFVVP